MPMSESMRARRFVLFDPSLKRVGGHEFDYDLHVLRAAAALGCETLLISRSNFRDNGQLPPACRTLALFAHHGYNAQSVLSGKHRLRDFADGMPADDGRWRVLRELQRALATRRREGAVQRQIRTFEAVCRRTLSTFDLHRGDIVFFPNASELDLLCLGRYLQSDLAPRGLDWHVQFHMSLFDGREPEWAVQTAKLDGLREVFADALVRAGTHRLHLYNTTDSLARQYNALGVAHFEPLPYPVNPALHAPQAQVPAPRRPLRITCAGSARCEKGFHGLGALADALWSGCLDEGRAQLFAQVKRRWLTHRPRRAIKLQRGPPVRRTHQPGQACSDPVVAVPHPLGIDEYQQFILGSDIGLFLYDSRAYSNRRAGVLGEMLAAGIPVVVPAGCWLADQIADSIADHAAQMAQRLPCVGECAISEWLVHGGGSEPVSVPMHRLQVPPGCAPVVGRFSIPRGATTLAVGLDWVQTHAQGTGLNLALECFGAGGALLGRALTTVDAGEAGARRSTLFSIPDNARGGTLSLWQACGGVPIELRDLTLRFLDASAWPGGRAPLGAVGAVAVDPAEAARLLRDIVQHYAHYRRTAVDFSHDWFRRHDPRLTVRTLIDRSLPLQPAVGGDAVNSGSGSTLNFTKSSLDASAGALPK